MEEQSHCDPLLAGIVSRIPVARKIALTLVASRLSVGDVATVAPILRSIAEAVKADGKFLLDETPFLVTLARKVGDLSGEWNPCPPSSYV